MPQLNSALSTTSCQNKTENEETISNYLYFTNIYCANISLEIKFFTRTNLAGIVDAAHLQYKAPWDFSLRQQASFLHNF